MCYTNLAKQVTFDQPNEIHFPVKIIENSNQFQYKDAFFSANPNFKWYKLPAPPLRTLSTRPGNAERPPFNYSYGYDADIFINDSIHRTNGNTPPKEELLTIGTKSNRGPNVGIFKLADEAQMGGLNSLMASYDSKSPSGNNNLGEHDGEFGKILAFVMNCCVGKFDRIVPFLCRQFHQSIKNQTNTNEPN